MIPTRTDAAMADDYSPPVTGSQKEPHGLGQEGLANLPDLQLPERGTALGAISIRASDELDLAELITTLRDAGAEIVAINTFPATLGEPTVAKVFDIETRNFDSAAAARLLRAIKGVVKAEARKTLGQIFGKRVIIIGGGAQVA